MFSIVVDHGAPRLSLTPVLGMREARPLKEALLEAPAKGLPVILVAQRVERLSTACAQLLVAFAAAMEQAVLPLRLSRPSQAFVASFSELGLDPILKKWSVEE
jgi:anti-anti-sigma regulatory factor